jgi:hypothetical protein
MIGDTKEVSTIIYRWYWFAPSYSTEFFFDFWIGCKIEIFGFRSTLICSFLHDTLLINGFVGVHCIHWRLSHPQPPLTHQRVAHTRYGEFLSFRHVAATLAFLRHDFRWIQAAPSFSADERLSLGGAWFSRTVSNGPHSTFFNCYCLSDVYVPVFVFLSCIFLDFFVSVTSSCSSLPQYLGLQGPIHNQYHLN